MPTPCVADVCGRSWSTTFSWRIYRGDTAEVEEVLGRVRAHVPRVEYTLKDLIVVHPTRTRTIRRSTAIEARMSQCWGKNNDARGQSSDLRPRHRRAHRRRAVLRRLRPGPHDRRISPMNLRVDDLVSATRCWRWRSCELTERLTCDVEIGRIPGLP